MTPDVVLNNNDILGECPVFVPEEGALYWVDIGRQDLCRLDLSTGAEARWHFESALTGFAPATGGGFVGAFADGIAGVSDTGARGPFLHQPEADQPTNRFNDAGTDPRGRFLAGTMNTNADAPTGALYSLDQATTLRQLKTGITICNTIAFSPDGGTLYTADTASGAFGAFDYDPDTGTLGDPVPGFAVADDLPGAPDGSAVDAKGYIWNARWEGGCLVRLAPDGATDRIVPLPVSKPTACAFVGTTLYVTSSAWEMDEAALADEPLAGALLRLEVGVEGRPILPFAGAAK